ncbi:hypothetical protein GHT06_007263 [Daphnia sinensis]|uniref:Uncharacterized protein n=1 Tax=Daphnia sinensis TaxID=1820382 RepID=A0AAD5KDX8_9CRUS|nr:hypothetical protein GHT06_007263 [Daphnia sinensis]
MLGTIQRHLVIAHTIGNPDLKWETSTTFNTGLDFSILKNRIFGSVEYYVTNTSDLLAPQPLPNSTGFGGFITNIGETQNRGIELSLSTLNIEAADFTWSTDLIFTRNREEIISLPNGDDIAAGRFIGQPLTVFYDLKKIGIWQTSEKDLAATFGDKPGEIKIQDTNKDGRINSLDRVILGSAVADFAIACQDALQEDVVSQIGSEYLNTTKGLDDAVSAAYSSMRSWYGTERGNNFTEFGTDIYTNGADGSWKFMNTYTNQFDSQNAQVRELWDELYRGINTCNSVVERAASITGVTDAIKTQRIAEAKFIRAHHYFLLVQLFGFDRGYPGLEAKKAATQYGRATRAAAEHLLGRVYVTKGTSSAKADDDFAKAEPLFQNVIKNYGLKLLPDFGQVHAFGNEINDEIIWSVQYTRTQLTNGGGNNATYFS